MSVLKSILHHWNSTSKAYDTLHPETEVGQITDFGKGLLNQLAATTAQSVISALQTNSWFGQLLKLVLNASGVKYSIDTNGYVCLGSFFGGLIIQWGKTVNGTITWPISFLTTDYTCAALKNSDHGSAILNLTTTEPSLTKIEYEWVSYYGGSSEQHTAPANGTHVIAIGH